MIATLMVEGMPLATADELPLAVAHRAVGVGQREGCREHGLFAPSAGSTVQTVVGVPVIHHFAELAGEDTFVGERLSLWLDGNSGLLRTFGCHGAGHVVGPSVEHVVVVFHTCRIHIRSSHGASGVGELVARDLQGFQGEVLGIARLVEDGLPHQHGGMVTVAADNLSGILVHQFCPVGIFVPVLPTRCGHNDEDAQFVERIHERRILRIVGCADDVHAGILQSAGIAPLLAVGHGITHEGKILMAVSANQLSVGLAVEPETVLAAELRLADSHADEAAVTLPFHPPLGGNCYFHII